ncbi:MAG: hypothetical protein JXQ26_05755 [Tissierellales bacterium]|nr:hypothetical protein [Tissierellales bacterium]MBN2827471.1 hypothetical protein [Tissierellales bacterium]
MYEENNIDDLEDYYGELAGNVRAGSGLNILIRLNINNYFVSANFKMKDYHTN